MTRPAPSFFETACAIISPPAATTPDPRWTAYVAKLAAIQADVERLVETTPERARQVANLVETYGVEHVLRYPGLGDHDLSVVSVLRKYVAAVEAGAASKARAA